MESPNDMMRYQGLRKQLVGQLRQKNIRNEAVLSAIAQVPRHLFMPKGMESVAYEDRALPIGSEQTISQPYTVAFQTQLLAPTKEEKILEIGSGSGYQSAVLSLLCGSVFTIERQKELFISLADDEHPIHQYTNVRIYFGDGYMGLPDFQPFDKILITAAVPQVPQRLLDQLVVGGVMVLPVGETSKSQIMTRIIKVSEHTYDTEEYGHFSFVPMLGGTN